MSEKMKKILKIGIICFCSSLIVDLAFAVLFGDTVVLMKMINALLWSSFGAYLYSMK